MAQNDCRTREPGLAEALARSLDPDQAVRCYAVNWLEDGAWHVTRFADSADANAYALTLPERSGRYVVGTSAPRRDVHPPLATDEGGYLLCCNAFEEPQEHATYPDAVAAFNAYVAALEADGWTVERGWASRDNLLAARATKAIDSSEPNAFRFVQIVVDQS